MLSEWIFHLFWVNERFDEARQACNYGQDEANSWIAEHEKETRRAWHLLRKLGDWTLGYYDESKLNNGKPGDWTPSYYEDNKAHFQAMREIRERASKLGGFWITRSRNAKLAGLILEWLEERDYLPAQQFLRNHKLNKNPPLPPGFYFSRDFGYDVAQELGMDENTFLNLCQKAEPFSAS